MSIEQDAAKNAYSVTELISITNELLDLQFRGVWVQGEISEYTQSAAGHIYLTIKDAQSQISAVIYRKSSLRIRFKMKVGLEILLNGNIQIYPNKGTFQLQVENALPVGEGALDLAYRQLREELEARGYFQPQRKRKLPSMPKHIALVTSKQGAAFQDMLQQFRNNWPLAQLSLYSVAVQGDTAKNEIAEAIRYLNRWHHHGKLKLDLIIVARGGGSREDLWAFNEEIVCRAIFESRLPIVSAVGHETDYSLSDEVADKRATTPTQAATDTVPNRRELWRNLTDIRQRMDAELKDLIAARQKLLDQIARRPCFLRPLDKVAEHQEKLERVQVRINRAMTKLIAANADKIRTYADRLVGVNPLAVLTRGYSVTTNRAGHAVRSIQEVQEGEEIITTVGDGVIKSIVQSTSDNSPAKPLS
ncbi:MAG: exodeoxyribonuclease VII large subunit [Zavarzinella sp.]